ncbi:MAG TPA: Rieske (2Fe-2S) protein [Jatrophihabitans sp.]|jgi:Rieske Fe-S protein
MTAPDKTDTASPPNQPDVSRNRGIRSGGPRNGVSRRSVLTVGAAGVVGTVALAACSQAKPPVSSDAGASGPSTPADSTAGTASSAATSSSASDPTSSSAGGNQTVLAKLADVPVGGAISAQDAGGQPILISRPSDSAVAAFSAICPHQGCTVANTFHCPCHGSVFDPKTGAHLAGPAPTGLNTMAVKISGANIVAG